MAFTYTVDASKYAVFGNKRRVAGTYASSGGDTGGAIVTGLQRVETFNNTVAPGVSPATVAAISGGTVTITTTANQTGVWEAIGY